MNSSNNATAAVMLLLAAVAVVGLTMIRVDRPQQPQATTRDGAVTPAGFFVNTLKSGDYYREQINRNPEVADNYVQLAQLQMQLSRETGDERRYIPEAKQLIEQALDREPANYRARILETTLLNSLHRFDEARDKLRGLVAENPHHAYLRGALIDALVELGHYDEAVAQSDSMQALKPGLSSYARVAYLRELHGQDDAAIRAMEMAANAGAVASPDRSWALMQLGNLYLKTGRTEQANSVFTAILQESPGYSLALAGLASIELANENYDDAREIAANGFDATQRTIFLEIELEALTAQKAPSASTGPIIEAILDSFEQSEQIGEVVNMELADFLADHDLRLAEASRRIEAELVRRPDHLHVLETHAWVLHKQGKSREALEEIQKAMRLQTNDAKLYFRAARIAAQAGNNELADAWIDRSLELNLKSESVTAWKEALDLFPHYR